MLRLSPLIPTGLKRKPPEEEFALAAGANADSQFRGNSRQSIETVRVYGPGRARTLSRAVTTLRFMETLL